MFCRISTKLILRNFVLKTKRYSYSIIEEAKFTFIIKSTYKIYFVVSTITTCKLRALLLLLGNFFRTITFSICMRFISFYHYREDRWSTAYRITYHQVTKIFLIHTLPSYQSYITSTLWLAAVYKVWNILTCKHLFIHSMQLWLSWSSSFTTTE